jgi:hypothetical protein
MPKETDLLKDVLIAAPCNVGWENMHGDEKVRFCHGCRLNVYNTSKMSKVEVASLLANDGNTCLRLYRRADGTIITENCPRGLRRIRDGWRRLSRVAASLWALAVSISCAFAQTLPSGAKKSDDGNTTAVKTEASGGGQPEILPITHAAISPQDPAQRAAYFKTAKLLDEARLSVGHKNSKEADQYFQQAITSLADAGHDPAFERLVLSEYVGFLNSQNRSGEAKEILAKIAKLKGRNSEVSVIDGHPYSSSRSERHQKTTPTLPLGCPIPDNE